MEERYLIDTSAVIKYLNGNFPIKALRFIDDIVDELSTISFITEIELKVWNPTNPDDIVIYYSFVENSVVLNLSASIIAHTINIRKEYKLKLPDAFIAATAITNNLTLLADNDKDFLKVSELKYLNPQNL